MWLRTTTIPSRMQKKRSPLVRQSCLHILRSMSSSATTPPRSPASSRRLRTKATTRRISPSLVSQARTRSKSIAATAPSTTGACGTALSRAAWAAIWRHTWRLATPLRWATSSASRASATAKSWQMTASRKALPLRIPTTALSFCPRPAFILLKT